ncbi:MAG: hypothetical protein EOM10_07050 [Opitutae bacterium]|nr:hypothetical protein [Opitutae bacterium]
MGATERNRKTETQVGGEMSQIILTISSRPEDVSLLAAAIRGLCESVAFDPVALMQIELAVVEAVAAPCKP